MRFLTGVLLVLIAYYVFKAVWRLYKVVQSDGQGRRPVPKKKEMSDDYGEKLEVKDASWRDLP
ncbi:MAG: hypothetical protein OXF06_09280 [Bacteroidetes bacterium]|nr:hypothetical protein [Bacteroidota bacterium]